MLQADIIEKRMREARGNHAGYMRNPIVCPPFHPFREKER